MAEQYETPEFYSDQFMVSGGPYGLVINFKASPPEPGPGKIPDTVAMFDMVGFMQASALGSKMRRVLNFQAVDKTITKARARKSFDRGIMVPDGVDAWASVQKEIDEHV